MDPLYPLVHLCATGYYPLYCGRHLSQSQYLLLRYVISQAASTQISYVALWLPPCSLVTVVQVTTDVAFCSFSPESSNALQAAWGITALRIILSFMLLILAVFSTLRESVAMHKATKQWQPNHYMQLFVKDGILYFLAYVSPFFQFHSFSLPPDSQVRAKN